VRWWLEWFFQLLTPLLLLLLELLQLLLSVLLQQLLELGTFWLLPFLSFLLLRLLQPLLRLCWRFLKYTFHTANMHTNSIKYHQTIEIGLFMLTKFHSFGEHMCM